MNWDAIGAIGQAVSALALIVVIVQVRHARLDSRRALSEGRTQTLREINSHFLDEKVRSTWLKAMIALGMQIAPDMTAMMERAKLTQDEAVLVGMLTRMQWGYTTHMIPNIDELPAIERYAFEDSIRRLYGANGGGGPHHIFYEATKHMWHPDAVRYVDNLLAQQN